jgi:hypothetical protein
MFIREIKKKQLRTGKVYVYHRLTESVRTRKGPRQNLILNLGFLDLPRDQWKSLAKRIEEILGGGKCLLTLAPRLEGLAQEFARRVKLRRAQNEAVARSRADSGHWETVDLNSLCHEQIRTVGAEAVGYWAFKQLGLPGMLKDLGFSQRQVLISALLIVGWLIYPASEQETLRWAQTESALDEVLGVDLSTLGLGAVYRTCDELVRNREKIEARLADLERSLFNQGEGYVLYDLTVVCPTGSAEERLTAKRRPSEHRRNDSSLLTLALVLDENGFPKASKLCKVNLSEPATMEEILDAVHPLGQLCLYGGQPPMVVIDAGVANGVNLSLISRRKWDYLCVNRTRPGEAALAGPFVIRSTPEYPFHGIRIEKDNEVFLCCDGNGRGAKEQFIGSRLRQRWEGGLAAIAAALSKKGGVKRYDKVLGRLIRLRACYPSAARFYEVKVEQAEGIATRLTWSIREEQNLDMRLPGGYLIRSNRTDLDETRLWSLYNVLAMVADNFRSLDRGAGSPSVRRRHDRQIEGRQFISVCACHLLATIHRRLRQAGIEHRWEMIRPRLATQLRSDVSMNNRLGDRIMIRQTTEPESFHQEVYRALGINMKPLSIKKGPDGKKIRSAQKPPPVFH